MTSVFYAATHLEARVCGPGPIAVVGGGNSAGQAAVFLAAHAKHVLLIVRDRDLYTTMSRYLIDQVDGDPHVEVLLHTEVRELVGDRTLREILIEDNASGQRRSVPASALFVFIGADPCTDWLTGAVALHRHGFVLTGAAAATAHRSPAPDHQRRPPAMLETSASGVCAVGDVRSGSIKRVASAVGEGAMAVRLVHEHLAR